MKSVILAEKFFVFFNVFFFLNAWLFLYLCDTVQYCEIFVSLGARVLAESFQLGET